MGSMSMVDFEWLLVSVIVRERNYEPGDRIPI